MGRYELGSRSRATGVKLRTRFDGLARNQQVADPLQYWLFEHSYLGMDLEFASGDRRWYPGVDLAEVTVAGSEVLTAPPLWPNQNSAGKISGSDISKHGERRLSSVATRSQAHG